VGSLLSFRISIHSFVLLSIFLPRAGVRRSGVSIVLGWGSMPLAVVLIFHTSRSILWLFH